MIPARHCRRFERREAERNLYILQINDSFTRDGVANLTPVNWLFNVTPIDFKEIDEDDSRKFFFYFARHVFFLF